MATPCFEPRQPGSRINILSLSSYLCLTDASSVWDFGALKDCWNVNDCQFNFLLLPVSTCPPFTQHEQKDLSLPPSFPLSAQVPCSRSAIVLNLDCAYFLGLFSKVSVCFFCVCVFSILSCPFCHCQYSFLPSSIILLFEIFLSLSPVTYQYYTEAVNLLQHPSLSDRELSCHFSQLYLFTLLVRDGFFTIEGGVFTSYFTPSFFFLLLLGFGNNYLFFKS